MSDRMRSLRDIAKAAGDHAAIVSLGQSLIERRPMWLDDFFDRQNALKRKPLTQAVYTLHDGAAHMALGIEIGKAGA